MLRESQCGDDHLDQFGELTDTTVLFRLKEGVTQAQLATWSQMARDMVGKIPGQSIIRVDGGPRSC